MVGRLTVHNLVLGTGAIGEPGGANVYTFISAAVTAQDVVWSVVLKHTHESPSEMCLIRANVFMLGRIGSCMLVG